MEKSEIYKKAFQLFVAKDDFRPELQKPFIQNGVNYATDVHSLIILPESFAKLDFEEQLKTKVESVIPKNENMNIEIKISELKEKMILEMIDEEIFYGANIDCPECDGHGEVTWEYDGKNKTHEKEYDCPECDGSGLSEKRRLKPTGNKIPNPIAKYRLFDVGFQYEQIGRLIELCELLKIETIYKTFGERTTSNIFKVGDFKILIMPSFMTDENINEYTIII